MRIGKSIDFYLFSLFVNTINVNSFSILNSKLSKTQATKRKMSFAALIIQSHRLHSNYQSFNRR